MPEYQIVPKERPTFYFIGVTTRSSSINKIFPRWMQVLGRPEVMLEGIDHKIHDRPEAYRSSVAQIKYDPMAVGGLVTTHKIDLYNAARDMFEYLDPLAQITSELSCITKAGGRLEGYAKDPITAGKSLDAIIGKDYFAKTGGHVLSLGAGGSALATLLHLIYQPDKGDRPEKFIAVNRTQERLDHMRAMVEQLETDIQVETILNHDPLANDRILAALPDHSIVINATGMGKDTPGSPITDAGVFPRNAIAWEFNYRGELDFLHQARRQAGSRRVRVEDGWVYFLYGWSEIVAQALQIELSPELFQELDEAASAVR
jgi:shikimate dehydrogenase